MLTTSRTLALSVVVVSLVHGIGAFIIKSLANGTKHRAPQSITTGFYARVNKASDNVDTIGACLSTEKVAQAKRLDRTHKILLGTLDGKASGVLTSSEQTRQDLHTRTVAFEAAIYGKGKFDDLQRLENEIFHLSKRADTLDKYLAAKGHQAVQAPTAIDSHPRRMAAA